MIGPLLDLPAHLQERLARALETGVLSTPYGEPAVRSALGTHTGAHGVCEALKQFEAQGIAGSAVALALDVASRTAARVDRPDLVWSGPEVPGLHARDTRRVYQELIASAQHSIWVSTTRTTTGLGRSRPWPPGWTKCLACRSRCSSTSSASPATSPQPTSWSSDSPTAFGRRTGQARGNRRCSTIRGHLRSSGSAVSRDAKAVVADDQSAFVTSANLTEAAFDRNIEVGVLSRDHQLAASSGKAFPSPNRPEPPATLAVDVRPEPPLDGDRHTFAGRALSSYRARPTLPLRLSVT